MKSEIRNAAHIDPPSGEPMELVVEVCESGHGEWCERHEGEAIIGLFGELDTLQAVAATAPGCHACDTEVSDGAENCPDCGAKVVLDCPSCKGAMRSIRLAGVTLDICPNDHGTWFDASELDRLTHLFNTQVDTSPTGKLLLNCGRCNKKQISADQAYLAEESVVCGDCLSRGFSHQVIALRARRTRRSRDRHKGPWHGGNLLSSGGHWAITRLGKL